MRLAVPLHGVAFRYSPVGTNVCDTVIEGPTHVILTRDTYWVRRLADTLIGAIWFVGMECSLGTS